MVSRSEQVAAHAEEILHGPVHREKALRLRGRFEPTHLAFPLPGRLVRDFGAVVEKTSISGLGCGDRRLLKERRRSVLQAENCAVLIKLTVSIIPLPVGVTR